MSSLKIYTETNVMDASVERIKIIFDNFSKIYVAYSGGKDSTVMLHLVMSEAIKRNLKVGILYVDLEAQYTMTIDHSKKLFDKYKENIDLYWVCLPISLRNSVSNFEPRWKCWDAEKENIWVRDMPKEKGVVSDCDFFPFFVDGYEFEEFVPEFGKWYGKGELTACFVGIRCDESLNRFRTISSRKKITYNNFQWTTKIDSDCDVYNVYPIYDWRVSDLWIYHSRNPSLEYNKIYEYMFKAGLSPSEMRLCQPYGDDQKKGLWLYHILEPGTWFKVLNRVNGTTGGSLYAKESGNISGARKIYKPDNHTWETFCHLLLKSLPSKTADNYMKKFKVFIGWWKKRGYEEIPQESPEILEAKRLAPSWRRMCKAILRNDYWCKGLGFSQPKSEAYGKYLQIKKRKKMLGII